MSILNSEISSHLSAMSYRTPCAKFVCRPTVYLNNHSISEHVRLNNYYRSELENFPCFDEVRKLKFKNENVYNKSIIVYSISYHISLGISPKCYHQKSIKNFLFWYFCRKQKKLLLWSFFSFRISCFFSLLLNALLCWIVLGKIEVFA